MRIIAGIHRRRHLLSPANQSTRPMPGRMRETLFSILGELVEGKVFVDLYAGSGAVGLEALSRGAARVIFVEFGAAAAETVRRNIRTLGVEALCSVLQTKTENVLPAIDGDIYFLAPPYLLTEEYEKSLGLLGERPRELVIAQHARKHVLVERYGGLERFRVVTQGSNSLSFYKPAKERSAEGG